MHTLHQAVEEYFLANQNQLKEFYPGIQLNYLLSFFDNSAKQLPIGLVRVELRKIFEQLGEGCPLEYIFEKSFLYQLPIKVKEGALIPRFDTEILINEAEKIIDKDKLKSVIDIGTGPGSILLNLVNTCDSLELASGVDIDEDVLKLANKNEFLLGNSLSPKCQINWVISDRFEKVEGVFDIIVTNPPYIKREEHSNLVHTKTAEYEPDLALFLDDKEYNNWFDKLFRDAASYLVPNGHFLMEGHEHELKKLATIMKQYFNDIEIIKDLGGADRLIKGRKK